MRRTRLIAVLGGIAVVGTVAGAVGPLMSRVEQPGYLTIRSRGAFELRAYPPMIVARVLVVGERKAAIGEGFRILAGYIFGANDGGRKVSMTAPVMQRAADAGELTATAGPRGLDGPWAIDFMMPKAWTMRTLPRPADGRVRLMEVPAAQFAAVRFSGLAGDAAIERQTRGLSDFVEREGMRPVGPPMAAFYNPPWTLPFMRRNEVMVMVELLD